jgi:hypothetical protein
VWAPSPGQTRDVSPATAAMKAGGSLTVHPVHRERRYEARRWQRHEARRWIRNEHRYAPERRCRRWAHPRAAPGWWAPPGLRHHRPAFGRYQRRWVPPHFDDRGYRVPGGWVLLWRFD